MPEAESDGWWNWLTGSIGSLWNMANGWLTGLGQDAAYYWTTIRKGYASFGTFSPPEPTVKLLGDGRNVRLMLDLTYTDPENVKWPVPKSKENDNDTFNGASIPDVLWSTIGSPWVGRYRNASLVHDYYCKHHLRSWREVHRMFYHGCLAGGVRPSKAKVMFAAVYAKGPRWKFELPDGTKTEDWEVVVLSRPKRSESVEPFDATRPEPPTPVERPVERWTPEITDDDVQGINRWLQRGYPDIASIEAEIDRRVK